MCLRTTEIIKTEFRQDHCLTCLALMSPEERRLQLPRFQTLNEYLAPGSMHSSFTRPGVMMPQSSNEVYEGLDIDFGWDLKAQNADLFGVEMQSRDQEGSRGLTRVAEWNEKHTKKSKDRQEGSSRQASNAEGGDKEQSSDR